MIKKVLLGIIIVVIITGGLVTVKALQIKTLIGFVATFAPPPEAVATALAKVENWADTLPAIGSVTAEQGVTVAPEIAGTVTAIHFESGATVKPGDLLIQLDTSTEEAQLRAAEAQVKLARLNAERNRQLHQGNTVSESELDTTEAALAQNEANADNIRAIIAKKNIRAPFGGRLGLRLVNLGESLPVGQGIVSLQSLSPVFVDFSLPQEVLARLKTGLQVEATSDAYPGRTFTGELTALNPDLDAATRSVRLRATFTNADETLRPGMFVRVAVDFPDTKPVLVIPATAGISAPYGDTVYLVHATNGNLTVEQKFIVTGRTRGDFVTVESGLTAGDKVVTDGAFKLQNNMSVVEKNDLVPKASTNPAPPNS